MAGGRYFGENRNFNDRGDRARNDEDYGPENRPFRDSAFRREESRSFGRPRGGGFVDDYAQGVEATDRARRYDYPDYGRVDHDRPRGEPDYGLTRRDQADYLAGRPAHRDHYRRERFDTDEKPSPRRHYGGENPTLIHQAEGESDHETGPHRGRGPKNYVRSDERIREDVSDRLADDSLLDASEIDVAVRDGEITLSGQVDTRWAKRRAEDRADEVSGVKHVQNNLRVNTLNEEVKDGAASNIAVGPSRAI